MWTGSPVLSLWFGGGIAATPREAGYVGGHGTDTLVFRYTLEPDDADADGVRIGAIGLKDGATIKAAGTDVAADLSPVAKTDDPAHRVEALRITGVEFTSAPLVGETYLFGEDIEVAATFNANVDVDQGARSSSCGSGLATPRHSGTRVTSAPAAALTGWCSGTRSRPDDADADGVRIGAIGLKNGATIKAARTDFSADLSTAAKRDDPDHKVDGSMRDATAPALVGAVVTSSGTELIYLDVRRGSGPGTAGPVRLHGDGQRSDAKPRR